MHWHMPSPANVAFVTALTGKRGAFLANVAFSCRQPWLCLVANPTNVAYSCRHLPLRGFFAANPTARSSRCLGLERRRRSSRCLRRSSRYLRLEWRRRSSRRLRRSSKYLRLERRRLSSRCLRRSSGCLRLERRRRSSRCLRRSSRCLRLDILFFLSASVSQLLQVLPVPPSLLSLCVLRSRLDRFFFSLILLVFFLQPSLSLPVSPRSLCARHRPVPDIRVGVVFVENICWSEARCWGQHLCRTVFSAYKYCVSKPDRPTVRCVLPSAKANRDEEDAAVDNSLIARLRYLQHFIVKVQAHAEANV